jgi:predicted nucleotide-binding protein
MEQTVSEPSTEPTPLQLELEGLIKRGSEWVSDASPKRGQLRMWLGMSRRILLKIFGEGAEIVRSWPIPSTVEDIRVVDEVRIRLAMMRHLLDQFRTAGGIGAGSAVFIGHGRSDTWRQVKDFVADRLHLPWQEFNRDAVAGLTTFERLQQMLNQASFALLVMTAEDEDKDGNFHARENVVHEVGLFQGRLGPKRAIVLLEQGCTEFSNIVGLSQLRFPRGYVSAAFEEIRRVMEREGVV